MGAARQQPSSSAATAQRSAAPSASPPGQGAALAPPGSGIDFVDRGWAAELAAGPPLQRRAEGGASASEIPPGVQATLRGPGQALHGPTRAHLEQRLGHDLSRVRVHADAAAGASARQLDAQAYTLGRDIVFAPGRYRPDTPAGQQLIAHEAVHVVQQMRAGAAGSPQALGPATLSRSDDAAEREAERIAAGLGPAPVLERPPPGRLHRFEARIHEAGERWGLTQGGAMSNEEASAVYFGNWMRDLNQIMVPLLTQVLPPDVLFSMISYMAATKFGRELTPEQFGYYLPSEHIDNPAGLVAQDDLLPGQPAITAAARPTLPARLSAARAPQLDTPQESVDPVTARVQGAGLFAVDQSGVMAFIRRTNLHIERRLQLAVDAGRTPDGLQHFGAAQHAVEDLFAHSNYIEIAVDHLLRSDASFLPQIAGAADRQVFTYSARTPGPAGRAVLSTGSFTGADTKISIASEVVGLLSRPLPDPATNEEQTAQDRFMVTLLRSFEAQLRANPELRRTVRGALRQAGVPGPLADRADGMPLADLYELKSFLGIPFPDAVRLPMKKAIRDTVSRAVLQPAAGQVQAEGLEARVADTSLIRVLRESQRQQRGAFTPAEREAMAQQQRITGKTVAQQAQEASASGGRRAQAIGATPLQVVAGPSHSQIAKDHPNSPFFGLAFLLKTLAVQRLRDRLLAAWTERQGAPTAPFDFGWNSFPQAAPAGATPEQTAVYEQARRLYHVGRPGRGPREAESLKTGADIVKHGGQPGQPYDLAQMRQQAAARIRSVATALRALAGAPGAAAGALDQARELLRHLEPKLQEKLARQLSQAQAAARGPAAGQAVADLNQVAAALDQTADAVAAARRHAQREAANAQLVQQRQETLAALARKPALDSGLATALLYTLDEEIQATAVAYSGEQRAVLEGRATAPELASAPALTVAPLALPPLTGAPALQALLAESRLLVAHPLDNPWWQAPLRDYARRFPDRLANDIEARSEGVPFYRGGAGHGHP